MVQLDRSAKAGVLTVLLLALHAQPAAAQSPSPEERTPTEEPTPAVAPDEGVDATAERRERALDLFEESKQHYRRGEFEQAAQRLKLAYSLYPEAVLLYNLARALESMGRLAEASAAYHAYLRQAAPAAAHRASAEQRKVAIERRLDERRQLQARQRQLEHERAQAAQALERERQRPQEASMLGGPLPWVVLGVGAAGLAVGGGLLGGAHAAHDDAVSESSQQKAADLQADAEDFQLGSTVALIAGGVVAAVGVSLLLVHHVELQAGAGQARLRVAF